jgi:hypothetical protein
VLPRCSPFSPEEVSNRPPTRSSSTSGVLFVRLFLFCSSTSGREEKTLALASAPKRSSPVSCSIFQTFLSVREGKKNSALLLGRKVLAGSFS